MTQESPLSTRSAGSVENQCPVESSEKTTKSPTSLELNRELLKEISKIYNPPHVIIPKTVMSTTKDNRGANKKVSRHDTMAQQPQIAPIGLRAIGSLLKEPIAMTNQKASVMIIGNISAGKSTFLNWYVQEAIQKTGMAIETSGFTYITSGRCVTEIGGESTLALRPHLQKLTNKFRGLLENLSLKTCPSHDGRLHLVDLIDTPGLADGELQYPFDVEEVIIAMTEFVDLFFIFFDPIGQALGKRMLTVVKRLYDICPDKLRFCLTKVDDIQTEEERIKVMCQTTQSLTAKINSRHGFDLVPIFVPGAKSGTYLSFERKDKEERPLIVNRLNDLLNDIEKVTERKVQDSLNNLSNNINNLEKLINQYDISNKRLEKFAALRQQIAFAKSRTCWYLVLRFVIFCLLIILAGIHLHADPKLFPTGTALLQQSLQTYWPISLNFLLFVEPLLLTNPNIFLLLWSVLGAVFCLTFNFKSVPKISFSLQEEYARFLESREFIDAAKLRYKQLNRIYLDHAIDDPYTETSSMNL